MSHKVLLADVVKIHGLTIEGGSILAFNSQGAAQTFLNRFGGTLQGVPKPKGKKRVNKLDANAEDRTGNRAGDGGTSEKQTSTAAE